jgi:hypothetical protein
VRVFKNVTLKLDPKAMDLVPLEIVQNIRSFLDLKSEVYFASTCKFYYSSIFSNKKRTDLINLEIREMSRTGYDSYNIFLQVVHKLVVANDHCSLKEFLRTARTLPAPSSDLIALLLDEQDGGLIPDASSLFLFLEYCMIKYRNYSFSDGRVYMGSLVEVLII